MYVCSMNMFIYIYICTYTPCKYTCTHTYGTGAEIPTSDLLRLGPSRGPGVPAGVPAKPGVCYSAATISKKQLRTL